MNSGNYDPTQPARRVLTPYVSPAPPQWRGVFLSAVLQNTTGSADGVLQPNSSRRQWTAPTAATSSALHGVRGVSCRKCQHPLLQRIIDILFTTMTLVIHREQRTNETLYFPGRKGAERTLRFVVGKVFHVSFFR